MKDPINTELLQRIRSVISDARNYVSRQVNFTQIVSNWLVGRMIVEDEQKGNKSAEYGTFAIKYLSDNLTKEFGSGYDQSNLRRFRSFYLLYPIQDALLNIELQNLNTNKNHPLTRIMDLNLSWTHHRILLKVDNKNAREFYLQEANQNMWSTRALERQVNSLYYERIISSQHKEEVKAEANKKTKELIYFEFN